MPVFVDDAFIPAEVANGARVVRGRWCHMTADTHDELEAMARRIGLHPAWIQYPGTAKEHYDLTEPKRAAAIAAGAVPVDWQEHARTFIAARSDRLRAGQDAGVAPAVAVRSRTAASPRTNPARTRNRTYRVGGRLVAPTSFVAIDFETCMSKRASPIQIGVVRVVDGELGRVNTSPVLPPVGFRTFERGAQKIHGLEPDYIVGAPEWPEILDRLIRIASTADGDLLPLVAHNASFERSVIEQTTLAVGGTLPEFTYFDTVAYARQELPHAPNHRLNTLVERLNLGPFRHHDAGEDAAVTAQLLLHLSERAAVPAR